MSALGPDLQTLMRETPGKRFSPPTCYKLVTQLIERLRSLHELGYVHNDIKLQNVVIGQLDTDQVYLIDFGLATRYRIDYN